LLPTPPTMQFAPPQNPAVKPGQFQPYCEDEQVVLEVAFLVVALSD
jgi:hypothetical protein